MMKPVFAMSAIRPSMMALVSMTTCVGAPRRRPPGRKPENAGSRTSRL